MLALASVWMGLATLALSTAMLLHRPAFTDGTVTFVLYFGSPGALCLAGLVLWAHRKEAGDDPGVSAQRLQAKIAIVFAALAATIVYVLIIHSQKLEPFERRPPTAYNSRSRGATVSVHAPVHQQFTLNGQAIITVRFFVGQDRERSLVKLYKRLDEHTDIVPAGVTAGWSSRWRLTTYPS
jgi:hypothetical protein